MRSFVIVLGIASLAFSCKIARRTSIQKITPSAATAPTGKTMYDIDILTISVERSMARIKYPTSAKDAEEVYVNLTTAANMFGATLNMVLKLEWVTSNSHLLNVFTIANNQLSEAKKKLKAVVISDLPKLSELDRLNLAGEELEVNVAAEVNEIYANALHEFNPAGYIKFYHLISLAYINTEAKPASSMSEKESKKFIKAALRWRNGNAQLKEIAYAVRDKPETTVEDQEKIRHAINNLKMSETALDEIKVDFDPTSFNSYASAKKNVKKAKTAIKWKGFFISIMYELTN